MNDTTQAKAQAYLAGNPEPEIAERVAALMAEWQGIDDDNAELADERTDKRAEWQKRASENSERAAAINIEVQSLLPNTPAPPQQVGNG